ncbi:MAG: DUF6580 family putative transport protein [Pseudomonadota bacterium]
MNGAMTKFMQSKLGSDFLLAGALVGLVVVARLLPHAPNFTPAAAAALFAGTMLHHRGIALVVPFAAMIASDAVLGFYDWRVMSVVYVALALPAMIGMLAEHVRVSRMLVPATLFGSLLFFATTNLAVWAFSGIYPQTMDGLLACYIAALPFLKNTIAGDLFWGVALFSGAYLVQAMRERAAIRA